MEKITILQNFPDIKLSYEIFTHNKVSTFDWMFAIPQGKTGFIWFTLYKNKNTCFFLECNHNTSKMISNIRTIYVKFVPCICGEVGTILYGTFFHHMGCAFFSIENIFYYKGNNINTYTIDDKINIICDIFKNQEIKQTNYGKNSVILGLPVISKIDNMYEKWNTEIKYKLKCFKYYTIQTNTSHKISFQNYMNNSNTNNNNNTKNNNNNTKNNTSNSKNNTSNSKNNTSNKKDYMKNDKNISNNNLFICKPDIINDIYHLYNINNNEYVGVACIPDYKTSIMMNKLFRKIKENDNLDTLEESDDESEFENYKPDKYVFLDKSYRMMCKYNYKFKKWTPIKLS